MKRSAKIALVVVLGLVVLVLLWRGWKIYATVALHEAVKHNDLEQVEFLLRFSARADHRSETGLTPLHWAAENGNVEIARLLLDFGVNVNKGDDTKLTPLHMAAMEGRSEMLHFLLSRGGDVNAKQELPFVMYDGGKAPFHGRTPLHWAVLRKHFEAVSILLEAGAEVNGRDGMGNIPLHTATMQEVPAIVQLLLEHGSDPWVKENMEFTPLQIAMNMSNYDLAEILEQAMKAKKPGSEAEIERLKRPPSLDELIEQIEDAGVDDLEEDTK